jgi:hypothetical protein
MVPEGVYRARGLRAACGVNKNGKDYVRVAFSLRGGEHDGQEISDLWYLATDQSARITLQKLQTCGARLGNGDATDLEGFGDLEVDLVIKHDEHGGKTVLRIQYVNAPGEVGGGGEPTLTAGEQKAYAARWRHVVSTLPPSKRKREDDVPF